jgi:hypothetical protein
LILHLEELDTRYKTGIPKRDASGDGTAPGMRVPDVLSATEARLSTGRQQNATPDIQSIGSGLYRVAYGGVASPYTYGLAADPLYVTALTQGPVDRASAGQGYRAQMIYDSPTRFFQAILARSRRYRIALSTSAPS